LSLLTNSKKGLFSPRFIDKISQLTNNNIETKKETRNIAISGTPELYNPNNTNTKNQMLKN